MAEVYSACYNCSCMELFRSKLSSTRMRQGKIETAPHGSGSAQIAVWPSMKVATVGFVSNLVDFIQGRLSTSELLRDKKLCSILWQFIQELDRLCVS